MEADFDSDDSGDPHGEFLALANKQLLIEREAEKILKLMNRGLDDPVSERDKNIQIDREPDRHADTFTNRVAIKVEKDAIGEETLVGKGNSDLPNPVRKTFQTAQAAFSSQSSKNAPVKFKTEPGNLPKSLDSHSQSSVVCSQRVALQSSNCQESTVSVQKSLLQAPEAIAISSPSNAVSGSITRSPGYQVLPQMTWQGLPIIGQPYAGITKTFPVLSNQPQSGEQLSSAINALSTGSMPLASKAGTISSSTTSSSTQPGATAPPYRVIPIVQQPFIISPITATTQSLQQTESGNTQSKKIVLPNAKPDPANLQPNGSLSVTQASSSNSVNSPSTLQSMQPNLMSLGQVLQLPTTKPGSLQPIGLLSQASGVNIGSLQSNGLVYQIPQQNLITQQSNGLQPPKTISSTQSSNNTVKSQLASLRSGATDLPASQPNKASSQSNSSGLQTSETNNPSLQSNSSVTPQASESANQKLASMWQVLSLLQQNNQQSPLLLNARPQQSTAQGLTNVVHCSLAGITPNILSGVIPTPLSLNTQTQQSTMQGLSNMVNSPLAGATPNILTGLIPTVTALNTQTEQNNVQGFSNMVNSPLFSVTPNILSDVIPTPPALNTKTEQSSMQGLSNMVNSPLVGATPNILTGLIPTVTALNTQTQQNTVQGLSNMVNSPLVGAASTIHSSVIQTPSALNIQTQQNTVQDLSNVANKSQAGTPPTTLTILPQSPSPVKTAFQQNTAQGLLNVGNGSAVGAGPDILSNLLKIPSAQTQPSLNSGSPIVFTNRHQILSALNNQIAQALPNQTGSVTMTQGQKRPAPEIDPGLHKSRKILPTDAKD